MRPRPSSPAASTPTGLVATSKGDAAPSSVVWGIAALLVVVPLVDLRAFGNPTTAPRYALLGLGVSVLSFAALLAPSARPSMTSRRAVVLLGLYVTLSLASIAWAIDRSGALVRGAELLTFFGLFLLSARVAESHPASTTAWLVRSACVVGAALGALAVAQSFGALSDVFDQVAGGPAATFGNKNVLATYLDGLLVPSLLGATLGTRRARALGGLSFVLVVAGITVTRSRGAWAAAALTALVAVVVVARGHRRTAMRIGRRVAPAVLAGVVVAIALAVSPGAASPERTPLASTTRADVVASSLSVRRAFDTSSVAMLRDHPFGVGLGSWRAMYPAYARVAPTVDFSLTVQPWEAHCDPLEIVCESGLLGGYLFFAAVALAVRSGLSGASSRGTSRRLVSLALALGIVTLALHSAVDFPLRKPASAMIFFVWLGLLVGLAPADREAPSPSRPTVVGRVGPWGIAVVATALLVFHGRAVVADYLVARARRTADTRALYAGLSRANAVFPYGFQLRRELARAAHLGCSQGVVGCDVARAEIRRVLDDEPFQPRYLTDDGALRLYAGDLAGARRSYEAAVAMLPAEPACLEGLASVEEREGHTERAAALRNQATALRAGK
ncbi:MAG: O-antigen ligase family protein [Polyangiaceae bacterium]